MKIKFLLDEHLDPDTQAGLRLKNFLIDVLHVGDADAPPNGSLDPQLLAWLTETGRTLVTQDYATMEQFVRQFLEQGKHLNGIFVIRRHTLLGRVIDELQLLWEGSEAEEWRDLILWLPL